MAAKPHATLIFSRHGESQWNVDNKFTGWVDVDLSEKGVGEAKAAGGLLKEAGYKVDVCYTSFLKRAIKTLNLALEESDQMHADVKKTWRLNERMYGGLTGLDKKETVVKHGAEQVQIWRRSLIFLHLLLMKIQNTTQAKRPNMPVFQRKKSQKQSA